MRFLLLVAVVVLLVVLGLLVLRFEAARAPKPTAEAADLGRLTVRCELNAETMDCPSRCVEQALAGQSVMVCGCRDHYVLVGGEPRFVQTFCDLP